MLFRSLEEGGRAKGGLGTEGCWMGEIGIMIGTGKLGQAIISIEGDHCPQLEGMEVPYWLVCERR